MSLTKLSLDLITEITKFLTFEESLNLNDALGYKQSPLYLLKNSQIFFKPVILTSICNGAKELLALLQYSSLNPCDVYNILYYIDQNLVTKDNKHDMKIHYNVSNINSEKIKNSMKIAKIILSMLDKRIDENNIINNPYCYIYTIINKVIIDYLTDAIAIKYGTKISYQKTTKFRYMVYYEHALYTLNVNMYYLYLLYLINLEVIHSKHLKKIRKDIKRKYHLMARENMHHKQDTNVLQLFNDNDALATAYKMLGCTDNQIYDKLMYSNKVSPFMKSYISR